ncbi:MAG: hypothetical protein ABR913_05290 [Sedimentisphaerales bacterium]|jgi:hypothetical protein
MPKRELSHYEIVANSFRVVEISRPIKVIANPDDSIESVGECAMESDPVLNDIILVKDNARIYGYIDYFDVDVSLKENAGEAAYPITPDEIVPSSMPLVELPPLFEKHYFYFVLTQNDISHVVSFRDLDELPMKLCLFTLIMELEAKMLGLFMQESEKELEDLLHSLPAPQLKKAKDFFKWNYKDKKESPLGLLRCTSFADRTQILKLYPAISNKSIFESENEIDAFFETARKIRNQIAHSNSIIKLLATPKLFNKFVFDLRRINDVMGPVPNSYYLSDTAPQF